MKEGKQLKRRVLIVDDEEDFLVLLEKVISRKCRCEVSLATSGYQALEKTDIWQPDVVLTDIKMPDLDGLELLKKISDADSTISTVVMTGYGTIEMAVQALKDGAYDFHQKPFDNEKIIGSIHRALERTHLLRENRRLQQQLAKPLLKTGFIGQSKPIVHTVELLSRLATTCATVLIRGESGTGKEVAARAIHNMSKRADREMITVNCPALPEHILESELFGYVKGAFTGAETDKDGLFLEADGSTLLLDEIGDIPVSVQTKLLRVLQEKEIQPLGQTRTIKVDVRVLASTNQNLEEKMASGEFREDLFYRLNVMPVILPTLSEIAEDIPLLAHHFLKEFSREYEREELEFSPEALQFLMRKTWKGNVRQLRNTINRATLLCREKHITPEDLMASARFDRYTQPEPVADCAFLSGDYKEAKEKTIRRFTTAYLTQALKNTEGNVSAAARQSGIDRQAFQRLMRKYKIVSEDFRK
ncbi:Fis family transcriptional regulator [Desulfomarina profundi]|uniref:Fis family transcriptional regulator n=1 Tax=Desulfomarina profundi TaxID=2772557 RepID=A0A8D5FW94_9BACT|nr:sigma-54 dependent transcriptional regulator [Desulfomarina profundi]BCL62501.1 Fis family transcriptional regulator [Desulfomarina profundi]